MKRLRILLYPLLFLYFFTLLHFLYFECFTADSIYQYGFSYALRLGEIPYVDFNMVVTPFSTFLYVIPLLFYNSYMSLSIFQALLLTVLFGFLFKRYGIKTFILLVLFSSIQPLQFVKILYSGYCFLILAEFILLIYLEEKEDPGFITGIVLSLVFLTKQTVGIPLLGIFIYYLFKNKKKMINMIKGYVILPIIFLIYLLLTNSFIPFFDQCFLGLFEFAGNNYSELIFIIIFILQLIFLIYKFIKEKNVKYLYLLLYVGCTLPSIDCYHYAIFMFLFIFVLFKDVDIKISNIAICTFCSISMLFLHSLYIGLVYNFNFKGNVVHDNHFEYTIRKKKDEDGKYVREYLSKYKDKKIILLSYLSYYYKIMYDLPIEKYDLLNNGNNGLNGSKKIKEMLEKENDVYIIIDRIDLPKPYEYDTSIADFVAYNYELIEDKINTRVYYKK